MKTFLFVLLIIISLDSFSQDTYWQQYLNYKIDVSLNDKEKSLTGSESIVYKNNSPQSLDFIWFHLWANAYKNESTALFQQILNDSSRKNKAEKHEPGFVEGLQFKINGKDAVTEPHPKHIDIIKLVLASPLKPGDSITISTPFKVQLPSYFSRSGYADGEFMACQWYPKPAVFDKDGWHEFPYLDMGEFYSEYADYKVNITVPSEYVVGATGVMQNADELAMYKQIGKQNATDRKGKPALYKTKNPDATKTLTYIAEDVPDFAWFAEKGFVIQYDTAKLASGKVVDAFSYYHNNKKTIWNNSIDYIKDGLKHYSEWIGEYEYPVVQAVEGPKNNSSGGMEYPMITLITSPDSKVETLDAVIVHEVGHNWFMSMLGSNERMHTWMDEGLNTYFQYRYEAVKYKGNDVMGEIPDFVKEKPVDTFQNMVYGAMMSIPMNTAIETPADQFKTSDEYGLVSYVKTAIWLYLLENEIGKAKMDEAFQNYFNKWKNKHPQPDDLKAAFEEAIGGKLDGYFQLLNKTGGFGEK